MTYCSVVAVLVLVGLTKKRFGHYAILKILSLRSPSNPRSSHFRAFRLINDFGVFTCQIGYFP